jgi:multidrug efflux system membrane fusion protein
MYASMEISKLRILAIGVLSMVSGVGLGCGANASRPTTARAAYAQAVPVGVATVQQHDMPVYLVGLGTVTPLYSVNVKSRVDGQLVRVNFKEGQKVKKGDLLAVIDPRPYEVALSQAQAQKFKDEASLRDAKLNYQRYKDLLNQSGVMSQQQVDTQLATAEQLEGAVRSDQAAIDSAKLQLTYCHITSPIDGRVGLRLVDPGNMVHATDTNAMLVITQLQPITAIFTLPEDQLNSVRGHMRSGDLRADAFSRDDQTKLASGKLLTIDNQIDVTTGTGRLKAEFSNPGDELWPNQFVNIHLLLETRKKSLVIPAAAVQRGPQGTYVFVVKSDKTVEVRPITVAISQNNFSAISSGLSVDETVVTDGQDKLQAGSKVDPRGAGRPAMAPGGQPARPQAGNPAS